MNHGVAGARESVEVAGRFTLLGPVGDRGLGEAWRARDAEAPSATRLVKLYALRDGDVPRAHAALAQLRRCSASGLGTVVGGGVWQGNLVVAYEECVGRSLHDWIAGWRTTRTPAPPAVLLSIFSALCSALHEAHGQQLVHERLSARSVIVNPARPAKAVLVLDAGVADWIHGEDLAACHDHLGPDALERGTRGADPRRADMFSLAVILASMLSLRAQPHAEGRETWESFARTARRRSTAPFPPCPEDAPPALWQLVERVVVQRDPRVDTPSKLRLAARAAWNDAGIHDAPGALREAPTPVAERVAARERPAPEDRSSHVPRRSDPSTESKAPAPPARAAVVETFSVPSSAPSRASAAPPAAPPATSARTFRLRDDAPGDTLIDFDDDHAVDDHHAGIDDDPGASTLPLPPSGDGDAGVSTLPFDDPASSFGATSEASPHDTLPLDGVARGRRQHPHELGAEAPGDPFASAARTGTDTLPIDDAKSPLANPIAPFLPRSSAPVTARPQATAIAPPPRPTAPAPPPPPPAPLSAGGDTLPIDGPVLAPGALRNVAAVAVAAPPPRAPATPPVVEATARFPARREGVPFALVVAAGLLAAALVALVFALRR